ncbi:MAG: hypothetical protein OXU45_02895 [Candidatus Melainabacteria bacterium]|nr:hypothetical protein [Candidatus Melainabacteria bacterium]
MLSSAAALRNIAYQFPQREELVGSVPRFEMDDLDPAISPAFDDINDNLLPELIGFINELITAERAGVQSGNLVIDNHAYQVTMRPVETGDQSDNARLVLMAHDRDDAKPSKLAFDCRLERAADGTITGWHPQVTEACFTGADKSRTRYYQEGALSSDPADKWWLDQQPVFADTSKARVRFDSYADHSNSPGLIFAVA